MNLNYAIDTLNHWARPMPAFAWTILWQSSLLIVLLFGLDFVFRRKVRASVRYALWLVVLVKLVLPPTLALPTGLGWWVRPTAAAPSLPRVERVVVTYETSPAPRPSAPVVVSRPAPAPPRLSAAAWSLLASGTVSVGLLAWMLMRWRQIAREARTAAPAPEWLQAMLAEARQAAGVRRRVRLRLIERPISPAVCGLFCPVILMPRSLVEGLPPEQLRTVLLHELVHLRRGDVRMSFLQALFQIVYWWHPLLWLANARIRQAREEAVDDAVMLALRDDAEAYAPTLLQVARLALSRPLASLGLVGILESRTFLTQRIERLLDFQPPRKAGLTLASIFFVTAFAALALPMGQAPAPAPKAEPAAPETTPLPAVPPPATATNTISEADKLKLSRLLQDGKLLYEMGKLDEAEAKLKLARRLDPQNQGIYFYLNLIQEAKAPRDLKKQASGRKAYTGRGRQVILGKLRNIHLDALGPWERLPLTEVIKTLRELSVKQDPEKKGINFILNFSEPKGAAPGTNDIGKFTVTLAPPLKDFSLADVLDAIVWAADSPIQYSIEDYSVVFSAKGVPRPEPLYFRTISVDFKALEQEIRRKFPDLAQGDSPDSVLFGPGPQWKVARVDGKEADRATRTPIHQWLEQLGVNMTNGTSVFAKEKRGTLLVYATLDDLERIERAIAALNPAPEGPERTRLVTRVIKIDPNGFVEALGKLRLLPESVNDTLSAAKDVPITLVIAHEAIAAAAVKRFAQIGVDLSPPRSLQYNDREGYLRIRAPSAELDKIEREVARLNMSPPQLTIRAVFIELPKAEAKAFWDGLLSTTHSAADGAALVATLPPTEAATRLQHWESLGKQNVLGRMQVTTLEGRQAQVSLVTTQSIFSADDGGHTNTTTVPFGPTLDVIPTVTPARDRVKLDLKAWDTEFLGYDDPGQFFVQVPGKETAPVHTMPLPSFRIRHAAASVDIEDGQTLVLGGFRTKDTHQYEDLAKMHGLAKMKEQVPVLADIPIVGRLFSERSDKPDATELIVLITPTIIDPFGNPVRQH